MSSETQKSLKPLKKELSTSKGNEIEKQKHSTRTFNASEMACKTVVNKQRKRKMSENNPLGLMSRLEEFSSVWNDCPDVANSLFVDNRLYENNELHVNDVRKDSVIVNSMKRTKEDRYYSQLSVVDSGNNREHNTLATNIIDKNLQSKHSAKKLPTTENPRECEDPDDSEKSNSKLAELKRKKAVDEQRQLHVDQKKIIKQALSTLDGSRVNKKVVFSDDDDCEINEQRRKNDVDKRDNAKTKRPQLFENDDGMDDEMETNLKLNPQFEGRKGQKLLELQSKFASDSRFNLDTRFYDSGSEGSDKEILENDTNSSEKEKQLAILGSIVNRQIKPLSEIKKSSSKKAENRWMVRFDPTREDHSKYILKPGETRTDKETKITSVERKEKIEKKKGKKETKEKQTKKLENKIQVSDEKFYSVKEDLKDALNTENKTEFSLLKLFGSKEPTDSKTEAEPIQKLKKLKYNNKNPFKFDSSESEPEEEKPPVPKEVKNKGSVTQPSTRSWRTTFFFTDNDSRLQEALEFLKAPDVQEDDKEFAEKRKILKVFIKNKFKNNYRKNGQFKIKLGGLKKKPTLKKKSRTN